MSKRVLLADDDPEYGAMISDVLEEAGFRVDLAPDGMKAQHLIKTGDYDVVILDLAMPSLNGLEVARALTKTGGKTPLVALTGHDAPEVRAEAAASGIRLFLSKSVPPSEILASLQELLGA